MDYKDIIAQEIEKITNLNKDYIKENVEVPKDNKNGDFSFPCFKISKDLKKAPQIIANEIKEKIDNIIFEKIENINGFLNFYISKKAFITNILKDFDSKKENYGKSEFGKNKTILIEYSSPNIAKPFHIGHLKTTVIGHCLYNIYKNSGYNTIGINYLGDYGTQFAKLIVGFKKWGSEYDFSENAIDKLADIYVRINKLCKEDESVLTECRDTFKLLENGDQYCVEIWKKCKDLSLKEFEKIYELLGISFDDCTGESFYAKSKNEIIELLEKSGRVKDSEGAKIVNLEEFGINTPAIIEKTNGSSIYCTRDLQAIRYRAKKYNFDECLYVVGQEQTLYFQQLFCVAQFLDLDEKYLKGLKHISYGFIRLPEGRMSSRSGNFVKATDVLEDTVEKVKEVMSGKGYSKEDIDKISRKVAIGAIVFDFLSNNRNQDQVFDASKAISFVGETGPYIQYTAVRANSVIYKSNFNFNINKVKIDYLEDKYSFDVIKLISNFENVSLSSIKKNETSFLSRYLIDLSEAFNSFYNSSKILVDDECERNSKLYLTYMVYVVLKNGLNLLGIDVPEKM